MINGVFEPLDSWWKVYNDPSFECLGGGEACTGCPLVITAKMQTL